ncbi:MAG: rhomboid family intramembrane serine protease [Deltaproteobacteria bacterium]|nr:rhomboid family intramembrane serine protease [Deltaproteobacteria bacterium]
MTELLLYVVVFNLALIFFARYREIPNEPLYYGILGINLAVALYALSVNRPDSLESYLAIGIFAAAVFCPIFLEKLIATSVRKSWWKTGKFFLYILSFLKPVKEINSQLRQFSRLADASRGDIDIISREIESELQQVGNPVQKQFLNETLIELNVFSGHYSNALHLYESRIKAKNRIIKPTLYMALIRACVEEGNHDLLWSLYFSLKEMEASDPVIATTLISSQVMILAAYGKTSSIKKIFNPMKSDHAVFPWVTKHYWMGFACLVSGKTEKAEKYLEKVATRKSTPVLAASAKNHLDTGIPIPKEVDTVKKLSLKTMEISLLKLAAEGFNRNLFPLSTVIFIALNSLVFLFQMYKGNITDLQNLFRFGANFRDLTLGGESWRAFTSIFLHANFIHFFFNMFVAWTFGKMAEVHYGKIGLAIIIVISGVTGSIVSSLYNAYGVSIGASGAVFGILGAVGTMLIVWKNRWHPQLRKRLLNMLVFLLIIQIIFGFMVDMVDNAAHFGGFAGGIIAGILVGKYEDNRLWRWLIRIPALIMIIIIAGWSLWSVSSSFNKIRWVKKTAGHFSISVPSSWVEKSVSMETQDGSSENISIFKSIFCQKFHNLTVIDSTTSILHQQEIKQSPNLVSTSDWNGWKKSEIKENKFKGFYFYRSFGKYPIGLLFYIPPECRKWVAPHMEKIVLSVKPGN